MGYYIKIDNAAFGVIERADNGKLARFIQKFFYFFNAVFYVENTRLNGIFFIPDGVLDLVCKKLNVPVVFVYGGAYRTTTRVTENDYKLTPKMLRRVFYTTELAIVYHVASNAYNE